MPYKKDDPRRIKHAIVCTNKARKAIKAKSVEYKGGSCCKCGYNKSLCALQFHHTDPSQKDFGLSFGGFTRVWENVKLELDKCILVCANCHAEIHEIEYEKKILQQQNELKILQDKLGPLKKPGSIVKNCDQCGKEIKVYNSVVEKRNFCNRACRDLCMNNLGWIPDNELFELSKTMTTKEIALKLNKNARKVSARIKRYLLSIEEQNIELELINS